MSTSDRISPNAPTTGPRTTPSHQNSYNSVLGLCAMEDVKAFTERTEKPLGILRWRFRAMPRNFLFLNPRWRGRERTTSSNKQEKCHLVAGVCGLPWAGLEAWLGVRVLFFFSARAYRDRIIPG